MNCVIWNTGISIYFTAQSVLEVVGATNDTNTINVQKGENLTLTCRSDLESLTLEYASVIYSDTKMINGSYTVSFTKIAVRDDDNQIVTCRATNATGESLKIESKVRVQGQYSNFVQKKIFFQNFDLKKKYSFLKT